VLIIHKKLFYMKKSALITILYFISVLVATAQPIPPDSLYLGQTPPGNVRAIFNLAADPGYSAVEKIAISPDGKYLFYESGYSVPGPIYWIRADQLIDSLRYTNFVPYVKNPIPDQTAVTGQFFSFAIPDTTFVDDDGNGTLTYAAKLADGSPLPAWLTFDTLAGIFSGNPVVTEILDIRVTATDTAGASASTTFKIIVEEPSSTGHLQGCNIRIFPNPTMGPVTISLGSFPVKPAIVEVKNLEGKTILKNTFRNETGINLANSPKGIYIIEITVEHQKIIRKLCVE
jgi:hypothetical protein